MAANHNLSPPPSTDANCAHLAAIIEAAGDAVISKDSNDIITRWNKGAEMLLGYNAQEMVGQPASLLIPVTRAEEEAKLLERLKRGEAMNRLQAMRLHKNGSLLDVTITLLPIQDESGRFQGVSEVLQAVFPARQGMDERQLLAAIVESSHDAIISKDLSGTITSWNAGAERLFQYTAREMIGQPVSILIPPGREAEEPKILESLKRGERIDHFETVRKAKDGRLLNISLTISPVKDCHGNTVGASKIARDITEQKNLAGALQVAQKDLQRYIESLERQIQERTSKLQQAISELESFAYSISHDMRAPLRSMQSFAYYLLEDYGSRLGSEGLDYLNRIIKAATRMDRLIRDVLTFSRVGRADLILEPVDVEELLRGILQAYPQFQPPSAEIRVEGRLPQVMGNEASLTQCLTNLLCNAVKFVNPGVIPKVKIWAECKEGRARLWFEDNGIGIAPEYRDKVFGIFQRLSNNYEGTGMGLAIVHKAAERMSGQVGFESEVGKGSNFWLEVALAEPAPEGIMKS